MTNEPTNDSDKHRLYKLNWLANVSEYVDEFDDGYYKLHWPIPKSRQIALINNEGSVVDDHSCESCGEYEVDERLNYMLRSVIDVVKNLLDVNIIFTREKGVMTNEQRLYNLSWLAANRISVYRGSRCYDVWLHGTSSRGC